MSTIEFTPAMIHLFGILNRAKQRWGDPDIATRLGVDPSWTEVINAPRPPHSPEPRIALAAYDEVTRILTARRQRRQAGEDLPEVTTAICAARAGSKRLPDKHLLPLDGLPLIVHSFRAARAAETIDRVWLSTDCPRLQRIAREEGVEVPFDRPEELCGDHSPIQCAIEHASMYLLLVERYEFDALVMLFPNYPLRDAEEIDEAVRQYRGAQARSLRGLVAAADHPADSLRLVRISRQSPTASGCKPVGTAFSAPNVLDDAHGIASAPLAPAALSHGLSHALATNTGEKCGLVGDHAQAAYPEDRLPPRAPAYYQVGAINVVRAWAIGAYEDDPPLHPVSGKRWEETGYVFEDTRSALEVDTPDELALARAIFKQRHRPARQPRHGFTPPPPIAPGDGEGAVVVLDLPGSRRDIPPSDCLLGESPAVIGALEAANALDCGPPLVISAQKSAAAALEGAGYPALFTPTWPHTGEWASVINAALGRVPRWILVLDAAFPLVDAELARRFLARFLDDGADLLVGVVTPRHHPEWCWRLVDGEILPYLKGGERIGRAQELPQLHVAKRALTALSRQVLATADIRHPAPPFPAFRLPEHAGWRLDDDLQRALILRRLAETPPSGASVMAASRPPPA